MPTGSKLVITKMRANWAKSGATDPNGAAQRADMPAG
ncbi:hypothetical protein GGR04_003651 [Aureimonas pseudogalii]|uniref:Uncharacterized protein n=1 Tax=Aureimonas pseudogalii TaxID=1744844 RepID=A0A7W6H748_9HYPH|nr:hypothetical protein [Aureimonas pseudogalii]